MAEVKLTQRRINEVQGVCMARDGTRCNNCKYDGDICTAVKKLYGCEYPKDIYKYTNYYFYGGKKDGI